MPETDAEREAREAAEAETERLRLEEAAREQRAAEAIAAFPKKSTVKLARDALVAVEKGRERPFKRPPTVEGEIRVGTEIVIYVPTLEEQQSGFVPYAHDHEGNKIDATAALLSNFRGVYVPFVEKES